MLLMSLVLNEKNQAFHIQREMPVFLYESLCIMIG